MAALFLREEDVARLLSPRDAIDALAGAFRQWAAGQADNSPRQRVRAPGLVLHTMGAAAAHLGYAGWKCYTTTRAGGKFLVGLARQDSGDLVALIEADRLGQLRTGAATAVAVDAMAPAEVSSLGLFGTGFQARGQLRAVAQVRHIERAVVYSRSAERRNEFAQEMGRELELEVVAVGSPSAAAAELPLVITATTSSAPVFAGSDLADGALVCAVGSNWWQKAEIDATCIERAQVVVCDSIAACRLEAGEFREPLAQGSFTWEQASELSQVVAGQVPGRATGPGISIFKSVGLALEDVAVAAVVYDRARAEGLGTKLPF